MTLNFRHLAALVAALALGLPAWVQAGEGHDHGDEAPAVAGPSLPRFAAVSETFELVGVLQGRQITLYLDRTQDNAPVTGAQIELDIAGTPWKAAPHGDTYEVELATEPAPGVLPVTATVVAGAETDLLAGELDLHAESHADETPHPAVWQHPGTWAAAAAAVAVLALWVGLRRRAARARLQRLGGAA